jgi:hypothetical protein
MLHLVRRRLIKVCVFLENLGYNFSLTYLKWGNLGAATSNLILVGSSLTSWPLITALYVLLLIEVSVVSDIIVLGGVAGFSPPQVLPDYY